MDRESTIKQFRMMYRYMAEHIHSILSDFTCEDMLYMGYFPQMKDIALNRMVEEKLITEEYLAEITDYAKCPLCAYDEERLMGLGEDGSCKYCPIRFKKAETEYGGCDTYINNMNVLIANVLQHGINTAIGGLYCNRIKEMLQEISELPES